jgi:UDP-N-acetylglucosamine:LPS N-acetylglucosamine transferase
VASGGGHWMQMMLLKPLLCEYESQFATTVPGLAEASGVSVPCYIVPDCNRDNPLSVLRCFVRVLGLVARFRPHVVISTGAAPGIIALATGRCFGARTIWLESVANAEQLSMSGRIAVRVAHDCITQWEHLAGPRVQFHGRLL